MSHFFSCESPLGSLLRRTAGEFFADNCFRMAAALAYHTAFSLAPLVVLIVTVLGFVVDPQAVMGEAQAATAEVIGDDGAKVVRTTVQQIQTGTGGVWTAILSGVAVLFGATNLMSELQSTMNDIWKVKADPERNTVLTFLLRRAICYGMLLAAALVLLASMVMSAAVHWTLHFTADWFASELQAALFVLADFASRLILYGLVFAAIFKFVPEANVAWRDAVLGGMLTSVAFLAGRDAIGFYLGQFQWGSLYGAGASLVVMLLWVYYSTLILLMGAEFTYVWANQQAATEPAPDEPALDETAA